ncbi:MAG: sigma-70 family RNA polymerase sigma factor [FCB group bacterium]|jgi:RNA polymerase sigma-70 factor (ECF subfamily)|nr:sigma-70 family RNA polymerase sigma factor [FCB group bacterium]
MSELSDWQLVDRARMGELDAFAELVRRYQSPLVHFCRRMVGSPEDAEDLAQESFVRVYRSLGRLRPEAKFSTVLFGMARNLTLNFLRDSERRGRGMTDSMAQADGTEEHIADEAGRPDRRARLREIETCIEQGLSRVSPEHRAILILREIEGLDYDAIAETLKCRKGTVKSRLARARDQLRARIAELGLEL